MPDILYLDCFSGASGDMLLGALLDLGADEAKLREGLSLLGLNGEFKLTATRAPKKGIMATSARVTLITPEGERDADAPLPDEAPKAEKTISGAKSVKIRKKESGHAHSHSHGRHLTEILDLIYHAGLPPKAQKIAMDAFSLLAEAEAHVHGVSAEEVHFHEVGAVDAIVDIVGVALLISQLNPSRIVVSPVNVGSGFVKCSHGIMPVPAPATAELLKGVPSYVGKGLGELLTPTGAALLRAMADEFSSMPAITAKRIGYGAGMREMESLNAVRAVLAEFTESDEVCVIECNIDDMTGEQLAYLLERLMEGGALDVSASPILMKKGRPGQAVTVMGKPQHQSDLIAMLLSESTTLGARISRSRRVVLPRSAGVVATTYGDIAIKRSVNGRVKPEFESCKSAAKAHGVTLMEVQQAAMHAAKLDEVANERV